MANWGPDGARILLQSWQAGMGVTRGASPEELSAEMEALLELASKPVEWPVAPVVRLNAASEFVKSNRAFVQERVAELHDLGAHQAAEDTQREAAENAIDTSELDALLATRFRREKPALDSIFGPMRDPADPMRGAGPDALDAYAAAMERAAELANKRLQFAMKHEYGEAVIAGERETVTRYSGMSVAARDKARLARADAAARQSGQGISPEESRRWQRSDPLGYRDAIESGRIYVLDAA